MALLTLNYESLYLQGSTEVTIILPDRPEQKDYAEFYRKECKYKCLWLLHGTFGDNTDWVRKSMIEEYACEHDLVVVMPNSLNSEYMDWPGIMKGYEPQKFFFEELMPTVYGWLPVSDKKEDNFIAGLSMGGSGALKYALLHPELFAGVASLSSSPVDLDTLLHDNMTSEEMRNVHMHANRLVFQTVEEIKDSPENLWRLLFGEGMQEAYPKMYFSCGTKDRGYTDFCKLREKMQEIGYDAVFEEFEGYRHEWRVWDLAIQSAFTFFGIGD